MMGYNDGLVADGDLETFFCALLRSTSLAAGEESRCYHLPKEVSVRVYDESFLLKSSLCCT